VAQVGTALSTEVAQTVIQNGETYLGSADVLGEAAIMEYVPLTDEAGNVIGSWVVGIYEAEITAGVIETIVTLLEAMLIILVLGLVIAFVVGTVISKGIRTVEEKMHLMEAGNFQFEFESKLLASGDEVGEMARSSRKMKENLSEVIGHVQTGGKNLQGSNQETVERVAAISGEIDEIMYVTEQLSSVMEETTASAEEMNAATAEVEHEIKEMTEMTEQVHGLSGEIKERAENLHKKTTTSYDTASGIYNDTNVKLRESIERAKAIDEIKELTDTILKITAKTNLLAINASIEATRAGEAGKGFAVVADQIRVLAENSKNAVSSISMITENVSSAVLSVVTDSKNLLEFVDNQVLPDYEMLVETSIQYNTDADSVRNAIVEISQSSEKLYQSIQNISTGVGEVTQASVQGAERSVEIAEKSAKIAAEAGDVLQENKNNQSNLEELNQAMEFFKF
ncbi:MAG: methyl-accepting chemotaxis protein, partial [Eubacteriales bacterium]